MEVVTPPRGWRWLYRATGKRLPERYAAWVAHDIGRDGWRERQSLGVLALAAAICVPLMAAAIFVPLLLPGVGAAALVGLVTFAAGSLARLSDARARSMAYAHQKVHPDGSPWPDAPKQSGVHESLLPTPRQWAGFAVVVAAILAATAAYLVGGRPDGGSEGFESRREACIADATVERRVRSALRDDLGLHDFERLAAVRVDGATYVLVAIQGSNGLLRLDDDGESVVVDTSPSMFDPLPEAPAADDRVTARLRDCR